ncbi:hypothetical protein HPB48_027048 [Haemaphysalis longicornis]|uniref:Beat protein n=1 Tax=Haemaphysalis longicornis TaxID=44386 RepID=A0A9J6HCA9_HAELO|nr:hypothetical protein HPB48_027048 [Haemaphysalis longicornis]
MTLNAFSCRQVPPVYERTHPIFLDRDQLYHSSLGLTFRAEQHQFVFGTMKLKCTATVSGAYSLSSEEIIAAQDAKTTGSSDDKPSINGGQASYHLGDLVNVTCSYSRYGRPVHLQWHLNDRPVSSRYLVHYPVQLAESGRQVTSLGLRFTVRPSHFVLDEMRIRCTATLDSSDRAGSQWEEEFVLGHSSPGPHVSEQYVADSKGSTPLLLVVLLLQSSATAFLLPSLRWAV